jgi:hypothetical protein
VPRLRRGPIDAELALGNHAGATADLEALIAREPLRERARAQLMLALYRGGRHADALATLHDLRRILDEEPGLVPSAGLGELERRILQHDSSLLLGDGRRPRPPEPSPEPPAERAHAEARPPAAGAPERRRVTAVAVRFHEPGATDPEDLDEMLALARRCAAEIVEGLGGGLGPSAGDQMIAGFGVPVTREDDVARCARP